VKTENLRGKKPGGGVFTIPNLLSLFRLCLIPVLVRLYVVDKNYMGTVAVLLLSGATDIVDGFIARHFNMVSDLGKVLDPIADKLTQGVMLICLITRFPLMAVPLVAMAVKELCMCITGILVIRRKKTFIGAKWHGKAATVCLYAAMILHVVWYGITPIASLVSIVLCTLMIVVSFVLYMILNLRLLRDAGASGDVGKEVPER